LLHGGEVTLWPHASSSANRPYRELLAGHLWGSGHASVSHRPLLREQRISRSSLTVLCWIGWPALGAISTSLPARPPMCSASRRTRAVPAGSNKVPLARTDEPSRMFMHEGFLWRTLW